MNLDFTALSGTTTSQSSQKPRGQVGTTGTQALVRVPGSSRVGDVLGTSGDGDATTRADFNVLGAGLAPAPRPQVSPPCPHHLEARKSNEINASPVSPLVPNIADKSSCGDESDREEFEERAAIMEFDGGMPRREAECAASGADLARAPLPRTRAREA